MKMIIREINKRDLAQLLELYTHLHGDEVPPMSETLEQLWNKIVEDENHHIIVGQMENLMISSCVLIVVPNLTHAQRPYAFIENVVTHPQYRKKGYATEVLNFARGIASENHCYKIMLLTGSKEESTLRFYEKAGYNSKDKTSFIQWLE